MNRLAALVLPLSLWSVGVFAEDTPVKDDLEANQAAAIGACKTFASAEDTYRRVDYNNNGILEYAQCLRGGVPVVKLEGIKLPPPEPGDADTVKALIEKMSAEEFKVREEATSGLEKIGARIIPILEETQKTLADPESKSRVKVVLANLKKSVQPKTGRDTMWGLHQSPNGTSDINLVDKQMAEAEGRPSEKPTPKKGYCFVVLTQQGPGAPGGRRSYVRNGNMTIGYALLAYPAEYGKTGKKCYQISGSGTIYEKDLGAETAKIAETFDAFDPTGWTASE